MISHSNPKFTYKSNKQLISELVIAQLVERSTVDRLVAGSNPAREIYSRVFADPKSQSFLSYFLTATKNFIKIQKVEQLC
jgi:hypothetical protein